MKRVKGYIIILRSCPRNRNFHVQFCLSSQLLTYYMEVQHYELFFDFYSGFYSHL